MKKRSKYRPKPVNALSYLLVIDGAKHLSKADQIARALAVRSAVDAACRGNASIDQWRQIFDALNMAEQWITAKIAQGADVIDEMQATIETIMDRQRETRAKGLKLHERDALDAFAANYAELLSIITMKEYADAQQAVEDRVRRILSGERVPVSVRVLEAA